MHHGSRPQKGAAESAARGRHQVGRMVGCPKRGKRGKRGKRRREGGRWGRGGRGETAHVCVQLPHPQHTEEMNSLNLPTNTTLPSSPHHTHTRKVLHMKRRTQSHSRPIHIYQSLHSNTSHITSHHCTITHPIVTPTSHSQRTGPNEAGCAPTQHHTEPTAYARTQPTAAASAHAVKNSNASRGHRHRIIHPPHAHMQSTHIQNAHMQCIHMQYTQNHPPMHIHIMHSGHTHNAHT